jgi:hypothetical protein
VVSAAPVQAESVYKWTDKDGVTHYGDRQPQGQESESVDVVSGTSRSTNSEDGKKGGESGRLSPQERLKTLRRISRKPGSRLLRAERRKPGTSSVSRTAKSPGTLSKSSTPTGALKLKKMASSVT